MLKHAHRALDWGPIDVLRAEYGTEDATAPFLILLSRNTLAVKPHRNAQPWDSATGTIANPKEI